MKKILLLGAGKIGEMIAALLSATGDYEVTVADFAEKNLKKFAGQKNIHSEKLDFSDETALEAAMAGRFAVLSAAPHQMNGFIARAAAKAGIHYLDLTEDVKSTTLVKELAKGAKAAFIPQCGLAPGFISIVGYDLAKKFDTLEDVRLRVGALTQNPTNRLKYNLTWSTDGLINEYIKKCEAVHGGKLKMVPALADLEHFTIDGVDYEAFNTSGGLGTLAETLQGKVNHLTYKTIRYPGHRDLMKFLVQDLKFEKNPDALRDIFEKSIPATVQDVVVIFVSVSGTRGGRLIQETYTNKIYAREIEGVMRSGIQITTASGICAILDLLAKGKLKGAGLVRQEDIDFKTFMANRFGKNFAYKGD